MVFIKLLKKKITSFLTHTLRRILIISLNEKYNFVRPKKKKKKSISPDKILLFHIAQTLSMFVYKAAFPVKVHCP